MQESKLRTQSLDFAVSIISLVTRKRLIGLWSGFAAAPEPDFCVQGSELPERAGVLLFVLSEAKNYEKEPVVGIRIGLTIFNVNYRSHKKEAQQAVACLSGILTV